MTEKESSVLWYTGAIVASLPAAVLRVYVLCDLWLWFVRPIIDFNLNMAHAWGILILATFTRLTMRSKAVDTKDGVEAFGVLLGSVVGTLLAWGLGAIAASWM